MAQTIFAPATASGKAGVAVIRVSGDKASSVAQLMCKITEPVPRKAVLTPIYAADGTALDEVIFIWFPAPNSYTGEDIAEIQSHGGRAVTAALLDELAKMEGFRPAERGEFTRRAVENGKMGLTAAEGLADLINAETEVQRKQALRQMNGALAQVYEEWRARLTTVLAWLEAYIDFSEEEIPPSVSDDIRLKINTLTGEIKQHLSDGKRGERLRDGYKITIVGAPNAGKSSLMNKLAQRDVAIVSSIAGTTRDVIEVRMDINGYPVIIADTAGLRDTNEEIEAEGIRRAMRTAEESDLILVVIDGTTDNNDSETKRFPSEKTVKLINKIDTAPCPPPDGMAVSAKTGEGIDALLAFVGKTLEQAMSVREEPSLTRLRHRQALEECLAALEMSLKAPEVELAAEDVRLASRALGKITGQVQVEELLDIVFGDFCIGK